MGYSDTTLRNFGGRWHAVRHDHEAFYALRGLQDQVQVHGGWALPEGRQVMATTYSVDGQSFGSMNEVESYLSGQGYDSYTIDDRRQGGAGRQTGVGMGEGAGLLGVAGDGGGGGLFGGPAPTTGLFAPGAMFGASASPAAAATGKTFMGYGYTDPKTGQWVSPGMDMRDGGGKGRSGDTFQGGPFSGLLNALGVRPAGYRDRQEAAERERMQMTPSDVRTGLLGGTAGTQSAVNRALTAAGADRGHVLTEEEARLVGAMAGETATAEDLQILAQYAAVSGPSTYYNIPYEYEMGQTPFQLPAETASLFYGTTLPVKPPPAVSGPTLLEDDPLAQMVRNALAQPYPPPKNVPVPESLQRRPVNTVDDFRRRMGLAPLGR